MSAARLRPDLHGTRRLLQAAAAAAALLVAAGGALAQASATVSPRRVALGARAAAAPVSLVWTVQAGSALPPTTLSFTTSTGPGVFVGERSGRVLGQQAPLPPQSGGPVATFTETFSVPRAVLDAAARDDEQRIVLARRFTTTVTGVSIMGVPVTRTFTSSDAVVITLGRGPGAPFDVFRLALRFDPGGTQRVLEQGAELEAWADLSYDGTGLLLATWELAEPASTAGVPVFRPLRQVRRYLGAGQRVSLRAPPLPTREPGIHLLRLRIESPRPEFEAPQLRYAVVARGGPPRRPVVLRGPAPYASLSRDRRFRWAAVEGAAAYRLEILAPDPGLEGEPILFDDRDARYEDLRGPGGVEAPFERPREGAAELGAEGAPAGAFDTVLSVLVPAGQEVGLSAANRRHLEPGRSYLWRVVALGPRGERVGESETRRLRVPAAEAGGAP